MNTHHTSLLAGTLPLTFTDQGHGRPYLLLHGAAGPGALRGLADALAPAGRAVLPTHPGFDGQPRPEWCRSINDLALLYLALLEKLDLHDVVLVGNSMGGWLATELALRASPRVAALVLLNAAGLDATPAEGLTDPTTIAPAERAAYAFHDPARFGAAVPRPTDPAVQAAAQASVRSYGGAPFMQDPSLRQRLPGLALPTLVLWGESDRIITPAYGRQLAGLIPKARFELVPAAGHFPQVEQLDRVVACMQEGV
ncbi:MAG: alpha/beta fold hydrolase [Hymenobacter sp.]|nr:MAG: alpha/beta fold hydrolase [Hymenobacter sp.]